MRFYVATWGCQMNDHDTEKMSGLLTARGFEPADGPGDADLVLLNTCSIREKAAHKAFSELGRLRGIKEGRAGRPMAIGVAGCLAQQEGEGIFKRAPFVDFVMGTSALKQLPRLAHEALSGAGRAMDTGPHPGSHLFPFESISRGPTAKAMVAITEGCGHACTYCVVPAARGAERHRPFGDIVAEVECLAGRGFCEVELLGQNVNGYAGGCTFAELLRRVAAVEGLEWIRFTTSHPMDFTRELAEAIAAIPKVAPFLHLPVQSGSDRVLRRMGRGYTAKEYMERVGYLGGRRESICLSTDFIVGFPGETEYSPPLSTNSASSPTPPRRAPSPTACARAHARRRYKGAARN